MINQINLLHYSIAIYCIARCCPKRGVSVSIVSRLKPDFLSRFSKRRLGKKAVSPLIATVLLIAFAVALGAVVMNWGSAYVKSTQESTSQRYQTDVGCTQELQFDIVKISGIPQICNTSTSVNFTIENGPYIGIDGMQIYVIGEKEVYKTILENLTLLPADIRKVGLPYEVSTNGTIQQIRLIPFIKVNDARSICSQRAKLIDKINSCK